MVKFEKRYTSKTLLVLPFCLIMQGMDIISEPGDYHVVQLFLNKVFGRISFQDQGTFLVTIQNIAFIVLFNVLFSDYIAHHFRYSCVYVFSRLKSRKVWMFCRVIELMCYAMVYILLYFGIVLTVCLKRSTLSLNLEDFGVILLIVFFSYCLTISTSLLTNLLSIRWGTSTSIFSVMSILMLLIVLAMFTYDIPWLISLNPMSCLNILDVGNIAYAPVIVNNLIYFSLIFCLGVRYVDRYDVALYDSEVN